MSFSSSKCALLLFTVVLLCGAQQPERVNRPHLKVVSGPAGLGGKRRSVLAPMTRSEVISAYNIPWSTSAGTGQTIGIVDAYGAPTAEADLAAYIQYQDPTLPACTTANGCFKKVNQTGGTTYPAADPSGNWGIEVNLDVQIAHAIAPGAKILLVVAASPSDSDLFAALDYAKQHASYVSMSWGGTEASGDTSFESHFTSAAPTVSFFASTGDNGAGVEYPSSSPHVIAVGGTSVNTTGTTFSSETGWTGSGGGCSTVFTATTAQSGNSGYAANACGGKKSVPDVSYLADPNSGVYVYSSATPCTAPNCFYIVGGTSLASPLWAARAAISGKVVNSTYVYGSSITYRDIVSGNNGAYVCTTGLDKVTGRGSWINS